MNEDLAQRVARLEAIEAVRTTFHRYLHLLDLAAIDELLGVFTPDAFVEVMNYPPGEGGNIEFRGREALRALYAPLRAGSYRHHGTNATIAVAADAASAEFSSYFIATSPYHFGGGLYEGTARPHDGQWLFSWWRVSSTWGWRVAGQPPPYLKDGLGARTKRLGYPAQ